MRPCADLEFFVLGGGGGGGGSCLYNGLWRSIYKVKINIYNYSY